ncbi:eukaryotic membrane protein family-domain-containing protein [Aspergillus undulatus]|uniref:eukaryotic membrane protein family-domain-containing protein n=1 Tax=Aspergillus undulatus TaxID=1810928 RepID=UPI003CCD8666
MPDVNGLHRSPEKRAIHSDRAAPTSEPDPSSQPDLPHSMTENHNIRREGGMQNGESRTSRTRGTSGSRGRRGSGEDTKSGNFPIMPDKTFGLVFEHSDEGPGAGAGSEPHMLHRTSLVDVLEDAEATAALHRLVREPSPGANKDKDRDRVLKLSPAKIQELTSSPHSIPYRAVPSQSGQEPNRRVVSDGPASLLSPIETDIPSFTPGAHKPSADENPTSQTAKDASYKSEGLNGLGLSTPSNRSRPHMARAVSTPQTARKQTLPGNNNERLAQTWNSRTKQERPSVSREAEPKNLRSPPPPLSETALPSSLPQNIPLPPVSIPTYLQLELASGSPSPLYIHRAAVSDFPYESARVKLERLVNFLVLPPALEQVLWFGILACLDAWLYSFTILPLRFIKAIYILIESWVLNLAAEAQYLWAFVRKGVGRVWRRRNRKPSVSLTIETTSNERDGKPSKTTDSRRRHRSDTHRHRRQRSTPSALLPDDKADILKGLLMITTCTVLMWFDASRMYHWIRGQAAIKLYVIYNVLEVSDRLFAAIGQDVLECLFSREALERRPDGRSKIFRPFGLFLLALAYTAIHSTALFYQVMTLNVAVNSYSNALITLLLSNQFVEIKGSVFKKIEKENLFQLTCADVVERFQLWLMLTIIASRNMVETGAFSFGGSLISTSVGAVSATNSTPLSTPPKSSSSILPQAFTLVPSSLMVSFSHVNSFLPALAQVIGPFLVVLGSEMFVDWLKHAYIGKFNNVRPSIYGRFLDILAKDYYTNAFGDQNLTRRLGLPIIPLSCLFFRVSVQTYQMFLAALLPQSPPFSPSSSVAVETTSLATIHSQYVPAGPVPSPPPITLGTIFPATAAHAEAWFRRALANAMPSPAHSVYIFTVVLVLTGFVLLLILKLLLGMLLLTCARFRYKSMKQREAERAAPVSSSATPNIPEGSEPPRGREHAVEGARRVGGWGAVEVNEDSRRWIYLDDPDSLRKLKEKEKEAQKKSLLSDDLHLDHVQRYEMAAKRIW